MPLRPDMDYRDYLEVLARRKWLIVVSFVCVFFGAIAYLVVVPPLYKSTTTILVIPQQDIIQSNVNRRVEDRLATIQQQITSRTRLMQVRAELGLLTGDGKEQNPDKVYEKMKKRVELDVLQEPDSSGGRGSGSKGGFSLSYIDKDPKLAMLAANRLASLFIEENQKTREQQASGTSTLIESQLKETKDKLAAQEERVKRYKMEHLGELPQELQTNLANQATFQDQYRVNADEIRAAEQQRFQLQSQLSLIERGTQTIVHKDGSEEVDTSRDTAQALITELTNRRNQLAELTAKYTERHPDVIRLRQEVDQLEKKISMTYMPPRTSNKNEKGSSGSSDYFPLGGREREESLRLRAQISSTEAEIDALKRERERIKGKIAFIQARLNRVPGHEQELIALTRDYDNLKNLYNDLLKKKLEANIAEDMESRKREEQFQILDPANFPVEPFKPKKLKILLLAFLLASGLGFGGAIGLEGMDLTLRGTKDFQHFFDLKVFARIPDIDEGDLARRKSLQLGAILGGVLLFLSGVLVFLWFFEENIRTLLKG
jgi:polysaccharide chain length determinant protein (PEP-CTERM system associated)